MTRKIIRDVTKFVICEIQSQGIFQLLKISFVPLQNLWNETQKINVLKKKKLHLDSHYTINIYPHQINSIKHPVLHTFKMKYRNDCIYANLCTTFFLLMKCSTILNHVNVRTISDILPALLEAQINSVVRLFCLIIE